jgi:chorismate mutase/prephenate dehydratase
MENIETLRNKIDKIDDKIADLLNARAKLVIKIGNLKRKLNMDVIQRKREEEIYERIKSRVKILKSSNVESIWKEIIIACRLIQS